MSTALSGTSMAAPVVSGLAALLISREPDLAPAAVRRRIADACTPASPADPHASGAGFVSARGLFATSARSRRRPARRRRGRILVPLTFLAVLVCARFAGFGWRDMPPLPALDELGAAFDLDEGRPAKLPPAHPVEAPPPTRQSLPTGVGDNDLAGHDPPAPTPTRLPTARPDALEEQPWDQQRAETLRMLEAVRASAPTSEASTSPR